MTARTGLAVLIDILRGYAEAGTADYILGTAVYFDGDQLQRVLDRHREDVYREQLQKVPTYLSGGSVQYKEYYSAYGNYEQTTGGTAIFILEDSTGADIGTASYSVDYLRGQITFASDTGGTSYYLTGRSYDLYGAAADIWRMKASHHAGGGASFDFSTDNMRVNRSQQQDHYLEMAHYYEGQARPRVVTFGRSDSW